MPLPPAFFVGANLPWVVYGGDFGANAWAPAGGVSRHAESDRLKSLFTRLRSQGVTTIRWFLLCDGRAGIRFEDDGTPEGLDDYFWRDVDTALDWVTRPGLGLLPVLLDFHWCHRRRIVNGVALGGHRHVLANPTIREALLDRVLVPLFERHGRDTRIHGWDLINEPEWVTFGVGTWNPLKSVTRTAMRAFIQTSAACAHQLTAQPVTVGSASTRWLPLVQGLGLDFYQPHWYDRFERRSPLATPVPMLGCDAPVVLGEFPTRGSARTPSALLETARAAGYHGAMFWSVLAGDGATDFGRACDGLSSWTGNAAAEPTEHA
jgi:hypothetical protein